VDAKDLYDAFKGTEGGAAGVVFKVIKKTFHESQNDAMYALN
jgi:hypothetical protein